MNNIEVEDRYGVLQISEKLFRDYLNFLGVLSIKTCNLLRQSVDYMVSDVILQFSWLKVKILYLL